MDLIGCVFKKISIFVQKLIFLLIPNTGTIYWNLSKTPWLVVRTFFVDGTYLGILICSGKIPLCKRIFMVSSQNNCSVIVELIVLWYRALSEFFGEFEKYIFFKVYRISFNKNNGFICPECYLSTILGCTKGLQWITLLKLLSFHIS